MFYRSSITRANLISRLLPGVALLACLLWIAPTFFRMRGDDVVPNVLQPHTTSRGPESTPLKLEGDDSRVYLEETNDGQSLMQAMIKESFGLKRQETSPFKDAKGPGYLGMSHDQNLNAWFDNEGATIRPTVAQKDQDKTWQLGFKLKGYGYGETLPAAPPIVARNVLGTRIEYERTDCRLTISNCRFGPQGTSALRGQPALETSGNTEVPMSGLLQSAIGNRQSTITEWYENRPQGIEQGFTINSRPVRGADVAADEPLRLELGLTGELRVRVRDEGKEIELVDKKGSAVASYGKLSAVDAGGKELPARLETGANGREISLVIDDQAAHYPILIDPIVATLKEILDTNFFFPFTTRQTGAQSGWAVAIEGNNAVIGSPTYDFPGSVDAGVVSTFVRAGESWTSKNSVSHFGFCGYSVAISGTKVVYGCPTATGTSTGDAANTGTAFVLEISNGTETPLKYHEFPFRHQTGDFYGGSVAINQEVAMVGAPANDSSRGAVYNFTLSGLALSSPLTGAAMGDRYGESVALSGDTLLVGAPGVEVTNAGTTIQDAGAAYVYSRGIGLYKTFQQTLFAADPHSGMRYAANVAISGNTAVVAASADSDKGQLAGAVYVFVRNVATWIQQQKIYGNDTKAGDRFGFFAVAIEGNTIVVGANKQDCGCDPPQPEDNRGAAYVFTRNLTVWTQQTRISPNGNQGGAPGNLFGTGVAISGDTVIVGAIAADVSGTTDSGAAYVYQLDCTPPRNVTAPFPSTGGQVCPGQSVSFQPGFFINSGNSPVSFQWRKNGEDIQGATGFSYTIPTVTASDAGSYAIIVSNSCGSELSVSAGLFVHTFSLSPNQNFSASGSPGVVGVTATGNCGWTAQSNAWWINITSGAPGTGNGTVGFTVAANTGPSQRTATMTIAGQTFTVSQDGLNCSYSISPATSSFSAGSGSSSVNVTATAGCAWTVNSNDAWLTLTSGSSGTGNGAVNYSVAANNGPARTGTLTVAGQTVTVTQANGCTYFLSPSSQNFPSSFAAGAVNVSTTNGCAWTAVSNSSFITVTAGANGSGNGTVGYSLTANDTTSQRNGTVTIAGQTFTVMQDGAEPAPTPSPSPSPIPSPSPAPSPNPSPSPSPPPSPSPSPSPTPAPSPNPSPSPSPSPAPTPNPSPTPTATPNAVQFGASSYSIQEDCTFVTVTVNRIGDTSGAASVDYNTSDLTATDRKDYITALGKLQFAAGETSKSFVVLINEDSFVEGNETFSVSLSNPSGVTLGGPAIATVTISDDASEPAANAIDDPQNYVCQHYHDFLNRQPDAAGVAFWTNEITSCGANAQCIEAKRINVSAAFYLSIEFQQTGYLVERIYKTAFGNAAGASTFGGTHQLPVPTVRLNEFLSDTQKIGLGVVVGQANWQQALEDNKQSFAGEFVQRSRFATAFPNSMSAAGFVDALNTNAGNPLSPTERNQLINDLSSSARTRAQVLRTIAEHPNVVSGEFNRAFVLMQFFGYLRRNPNDVPDTDYTGFDFWLTKLNESNGNYINAEMVKAFISASEYRQRFGQ